MDIHEAEGAIEAILFAAGEPVSLERIAAVLGLDRETVTGTAERMMDRYDQERRGIRLIRLDQALQLCSAPEFAESIRLALETRRPPQLTQPAMEVLAVIAYYQPVTRAYIEQVRGVDSSYTVGLLQDRGLVEPCGKLAVPGRPVLYRTTKNFLRVFALSSVDELPALPEMESDAEGQLRIQDAIAALSDVTEESEPPAAGGF